MKKYIVISAFVVIAAAAIILISVMNNEKSVNEEQLQSEPEEITMVIATYGYLPEHMNEVTDALNEISVRECGVKVNYIYAGNDELNSSCLMRLKAGETIDLMPCLESEGLSDLMRGGYIASLDELIDEYAPYIKELFYSKIWDAVKYDGQIKALPAAGSQSDWGGVTLNKEMVELEDIDLDYFKQLTEDSEQSMVEKIDSVITPIMQTLKHSDNVLSDGRKVSDLQITMGVHGFTGVFSQLPVIEYEDFGNSLGVLMDGSEEIVNLFETPEYKEKIELLKRWNDSGFVYNLDTETDENAATVYGSGTGAMLFTSIGSYVEDPGEPVDRGKRIYIPFIKRNLSDEIFRVGTWVIPEASAHKEAAMKILNLMYTNEEYVRTFTNGTEDTEGYEAPLGWIFGNVFLTNESFAESLEEKNDFEKMTFDEHFGFTYDDSEKQDLVENLNAILAEYLPSLENGEVIDTEKTLQELNEKLYAAGLAEIMADKQKQLEAWETENQQ